MTSAEPLDRLSGTMNQLMQVTQLNFDHLTKAMTGLTEHVGQHAKRLDRIEDGRA